MVNWEGHPYRRRIWSVSEAPLPSSGGGTYRSMVAPLPAVNADAWKKFQGAKITVISVAYGTGGCF